MAFIFEGFPGGLGSTLGTGGPGSLGGPGSGIAGGVGIPGSGLGIATGRGPGAGLGTAGTADSGVGTAGGPGGFEPGYDTGITPLEQKNKKLNKPTCLCIKKHTRVCTPSVFGIELLMFVLNF